MLSLLGQVIFYCQKNKSKDYNHTKYLIAYLYVPAEPRGAIHLSMLFVFWVLWDGPTAQPSKSLSIFPFSYQCYEISLKTKNLRFSLHTWNIHPWWSRSQRFVNYPHPFHLISAILLSLFVFSLLILWDTAISQPNLLLAAVSYQFLCCFLLLCVLFCCFFFLPLAQVI